jgi:serine acetyltransferase/acyl-CoA synthetase (AMP-forming)/AMP-acid ligase II
MSTSAEPQAVGLPLDPQRSVGVVAINGPAYARAMLDLLDGGRVAVPLRGPEDAERIARGCVGEVIAPEAGGGWLRGPFTSRRGAAPAMVSFSSGTEGPPKAVLLARDSLHDAVVRLTEAMGTDRSIRDYVGVPVHHSFGYARCRAALHAGGEAWIPAGGFDMAEIRGMLQGGAINAISAVPSQWRVFLRNLDYFGPELAAVRWVEIGSQFMTADEKLALRRALPNARIVQHYGLTEASRATLLRVDSAPEERLGSVGRAEGATEIRIDPEGRIEVRGPHVALGVDDGARYVPIGQERWLRTSDLGRIEDGWLYFDGRADDVINCGGIKIAPDAVEAHVRATVPDAGDFGITRAPDPLRGDGILIALGPDAAGQGDAIAAAVRAYGATIDLDLAGALRLRAVASLPRTATGKLQRRALLAQIEAAPAEAPVAAPISAPVPAAPPSGFGAMLVELLGPGAADPARSFDDLGADSLNHMQLALAIERATGAPPPPHWERLPFAALIALVGSDGGDDMAALFAPAPKAPPLPDGARNMNPPGISFRALVAEDFRTNDRDPFHQGFLMLLIHRFGNWRMDVRPKLLRAPLTILYRVLNKLTQILFGMKLDYTVKIGRRVKLEHFGGMILGAREIGDDVILRQNTTMGIRGLDDLNAKPTLGPRVDVGAGAVIVGDVTVGADSLIGANTVVYANVPPGSVVIGVPGRVVGKRPPRTAADQTTHR